MSSFKVTLPAREQLAEIADYTRLEWGERQMSVYMNALNTRFQWLAENPGLGKQRPELASDLLSYREGSHIVFYKQSTNGIDIIGVLHQSRDLPTYFDNLHG